MREGVTYKRLGEIGTIIGGSTPKTDDPENWGGTNMWVTPAELDGSKYISKTQRMITDKATSKLQLLPTGTVLLSSRAPIGKVAITKSPMYCNQGFKNVVCGDSVLNEYVYYCLIFNTPVLQKMGVGATFKEISKSMVEGFTIPVPSLSTQELIVDELDSISSVISAKKQQVLELDNLVQAIFLDTFGDPITNPKGWEVKKMSEVGLVKIGPFGSLLHKSDYVSGGIPLVNPVHMKGGYIQADMDFTITTGKAKELSNYRMQPNDFVFARRGDIGRCAIVSAEQDGYLCGTGSLFVRLTDAVNSTFMLYVTRSKSFVSCLNDKAKGATMQNINCGIVENLPIPLPPLSLQQAFAEKVQTIEEQKRLINQSIAEFESLLAQRMEFHFA